MVIIIMLAFPLVLHRVTTFLCGAHLATCRVSTTVSPGNVSACMMHVHFSSWPGQPYPSETLLIQGLVQVFDNPSEALSVNAVACEHGVEGLWFPKEAKDVVDPAQ